MLEDYERRRAGGAPEYGPGFPYSVGFFSLLAFFPSLELAMAAERRGGFPTANWSIVLRDLLRRRPLRFGFVVLGLRPGGVRIRQGPVPCARRGDDVVLSVIVDSEVPRRLSVCSGGQEFEVEPSGAVALPVTVGGELTDAALTVDGEEVTVANAVRRVDTATLRVVAQDWSRWSVSDQAGGAWFPDDSPRKWDFHDRGLFHARNASLEVPAEPLTVTVGRGMEFAEVTARISPAPGEEVRLELDPPRLHDPQAQGWYGADLHVHMNYGENVCAPDEAAAMQRGEGLHLMNLVAANAGTALIFDEPMLELHAGAHLPWSSDTAIGTCGVEYRNDLFGHFHALAPSRPPQQYQSGHVDSENDEDWPPNAHACRELLELGAPVGYTHPVTLPFDDDGSPGPMLHKSFSRLPNARELVADAVLGLVNSIDVVSNADDEAATMLYHTLLNCGLRLAATAGTDAMLSRSRAGVFSNPPGWARVYARVGDRPFTLDAWKGALLELATVATNGPWVDLEVGGHGPGGVLQLERGMTVTARARAQGIGADEVELVGPDGTLGIGAREVTVELKIDGPLWVAAIGRGLPCPQVLNERPYAHTSPVFIDVEGRGVERSLDAEWCLRFLDEFECLVRDVGRFHEPSHFDDFADVVESARCRYREIAVRAAQYNG